MATDVGRVVLEAEDKRQTERSPRANLLHKKHPCQRGSVWMRERGKAQSIQEICPNAWILPSFSPNS